MKWIVQVDEVQFTAIDTEHLVDSYEAGRVPPHASVYHPLQKKWLYPADVKELQDLVEGRRRSREVTGSDDDSLRQRSTAVEWKVQIGDREYTASSTEELQQWYTSGRLPRHAYVYHPVLERWIYAEELKELTTARVVGTGPAPTEVPRGPTAGPGPITVLALGGLLIVVIAIGLQLPLVPLWALVAVFLAGLSFLHFRNRSEDTAQPLGTVVVGGIAIAVLFGAIGTVRTIGHWNSLQAEKLVESRRLEREAEERERRAELVANRDENLMEARKRLKEGDIPAARESIALVQEIDPGTSDVVEVVEAIEKVERARKAVQDGKREKELLETVRAIPASDTKKNLRIYAELATLRPENEKYSQKIDFYTKQNERESAKRAKRRSEPASRLGETVDLLTLPSGERFIESYKVESGFAYISLNSARWHSLTSTERRRAMDMLARADFMEKDNYVAVNIFVDGIFIGKLSKGFGGPWQFKPTRHFR